MFLGQHPDEEVIFTLERQPAVLFWSALYLTLSAFVPILIFIMSKFSQIFYYTLGFWLIFAGVYLFRSWFCFKRSKYILTTKRLINIDQKGIFYQTTSEAALERIQDVSLEVKGIWSSLWSFGTIYVQTAGTSERFALNYVEEPRKIKDQIVEAIHNAGGKEDTGVEKEKEEEVKKEWKIADIKKISKKTLKNKEDDFWEKD